MSVTFQSGSSSVTLPDPAAGSPAIARRRQTVGRTEAGVIYAYDKGDPGYEGTLKFESLTDTEKANLVTFFNGTAQGCLNTFTYTDSASVSRTARFLDPELSFTKVSANVWDITFRLDLSSMGG